MVYATVFHIAILLLAFPFHAILLASNFRLNLNFFLTSERTQLSAIDFSKALILRLLLVSYKPKAPNICLETASRGFSRSV